MSLQTRITALAVAIALDVKSLFWGLSQKANIANPDFTGRVLIPEGTASAPGLAFANDGASDTGLFHISDGVFGATCNAAEVMRFSPTTIYSFKPIAVTSADFLRSVQGRYGVMFRNDGSALYLLVTNPDDPWGGWSEQRPFSIDLATGAAHINGSAASALNANYATTAGYAESAGYAVKLMNARRLNGVWFDGTADVDLPPSGGDLTQQLRPKSYSGLAGANLASTLQVEAASGAATDAAYVIFHRPGRFAGGFGLDVNNKWSVGGWSHGAVSYALYHEGNKPAKADVGLSDVDNTADSAKPVSTQQRAAIDLKALEDRQNMLPNGGLQLGFTGWTSGVGFSVGTSAYWGASATASGLAPGVYVAYSPFMDAAASTTYTLSGDSLLLGTNVTGETYFDFEVYDASGNIVQDSGQKPISGAHDFNDQASRRNEHKFTTTTPANARTMRVRFVAGVTGGSGAIIGFRRVKVERGTEVSAWSDEATLRYVQEQLSVKLNQNTILATGVDLNSVTTPGLYRLDTALNMPANGGSGYGQLIVSKGSNTLTQILSNHENGELFSRSATGGTVNGPWSWTPWGAIIYGRHLKTVNGKSLLGGGNLTLGDIGAAADGDSGFTIIYPNGGSAAAPANVAINSRYVLPNPFPGYQVFCVVELDVNGWGDPGWIYVDNAGGGWGVKASQYGTSIVLQTGSAQLYGASSGMGNPFNVSTPGTTTRPCRIKVWKLKGAM